MQEEKNRMLQDDYSHIEDAIMKTAAQFFGEELLPYVGVAKKALRSVPTETIHLEVRRMYEDFNYEMENGWWFHLEFESDSITLKDLKRFREYEAATSRMFDVPVVTGVICSSAVKKTMSEFTEGLNTYKVQVIRLKDKDADEVVQKVQSTEEISREDIMPILLLPLMSGKTGIKERILLGMKALQKSHTAITKEENNKMQAVLYAFAHKFLNETELEEVKEVLVMTRLGQMIWEDGKTEGIELGMERGIERGMERGIERGVEALILDNLEDQKTKVEICRKLVKHFQMTEEDAANYYKKYAHKSEE